MTQPTDITEEDVREWELWNTAKYQSYAGMIEMFPRLLAAFKAQREEMVVTDKLLETRNEILDLYPCPDHGQCVPHVLTTLAEQKSELAKKDEEIAALTLKLQTRDYKIDGLERQIDKKYKMIEHDFTGEECTLGHISMSHCKKCRNCGWVECPEREIKKCQM